jgi:pilus assembly protein CpaB
MNTEARTQSGSFDTVKDKLRTVDKKGLVALAVALVMAAACAVGMYVYLQGLEPTAAAAAPEVTPVVVASKDMTFGTRLSEDHIKVVDFPTDALPREFYSDADSVLDQSTRIFLLEGEPILPTKLSSVGGGLSLRIPEEMRAISLSVNEITGVNGFILPGDRVDVLVTVDNAKGSNVAVTKTILQNVEVLASGAKTETRRDHQITVQTITILVEPKGAESLALGLHQGQVQLALRNPVDHEVIAMRSTDTKAVLDLYTKTKSSYRRPSPTKVAEKPDFSYTVIRDGNISKQKLPDEGQK